MFDHQIGKLLTINQYNFAANLRNIASCVVGKSGCCEKNAFICSLSLKCSSELHNSGSSYWVFLPSLCLKIYNIKPKYNLFDYSIYATVSSFADCFPSVSA